MATRPKYSQLSNPFKFMARRTGAFNSTSGTDSKIAFDTEDFDTNNNFDVTTNVGRYTAPLSGFYHIDAKGGNANAGGYHYVVLYKNGVTLQRGVQINAGAVIAGGISGLFQLTAGDYLEIYHRHDAVNAVEVGAGVQPYFSGFLVSVV